MKTRLIFVRHAEAEGNLNRLFHGWTDSELTSKGHQQARKVAERLEPIPIDVIYSSSMKRTLQTAGYIAEKKNLPIIRTDKLKEINGGDWEGMTWDALAKKYPEENETWENQPHLHQMPNGESMVEFKGRLMEEVKKIINGNKGKNICIVTHGTAIKSLLTWFRHKELDEMYNVPWCDNTAVTIIDYEDEKFTTVLEGDACHLDAELSTFENQNWWAEYKKSFDKNK